jgi:hypothetical protein
MTVTGKSLPTGAPPIPWKDDFRAIFSLGKNPRIRTLPGQIMVVGVARATRASGVLTSVSLLN